MSLLWLRVGFTQNSNDCSGAIKICGDGIISTNATGAGTQEILSNACSGNENNSIWLEVELVKSGTLGFNIIPESLNNNIDYDFWIFGPNVTCDNMGNAIRCSTTNPVMAGLDYNITGMKDGLDDVSEGPGDDGDSYIKSLEVEAGETYYVLIDRFAGESSFRLEWTGTATTGESPFPQGPETNKPQDLFECAPNNTSAEFLLNNQAQISNDQNVEISYHLSLADATDNISALPPNFTTSESREIFTRVENKGNGCFDIVSFHAVVTQGPRVQETLVMERCDLDDSGTEIFDLRELNNLTPIDTPVNYNFSYHLSKDDAENSLNLLDYNYQSTGEIIYVRTEEKQDPSCYSVSEVTLQINTPPRQQVVGIIQPQVNSNFNTVTLKIPEHQNYEFSIGNSEGPYQTSTTFTNVPAGFQTLYIRDSKACAIIETEIAILGYDNYFTPNNDGFHDTWQIKGIEKTAESNASIFILNRYGKLLKNMDISSDGWDGTFNGKPLPADDYWFRVTLKNGQEFNGHFSLKR
ncbi:MAG: T9SS type B sorting domain-containing protein [Bacteroidota bacterium]|nr:T9SS type B sorting domain-containing protein [Bacteroidota bacterium]